MKTLFRIKNTHLPRLIGCLVFFLSLNYGFAQVSYRIGLDTDNVTYRVFIKSAASYTGIQAKISTAQITVMAPHGTGANQFQMSNIQGKTVGSNQMNWGISRVNAPIENQTTDYISFGYNGSGNTILFDIPANTEIEVFNFKNTGNCIGAVKLIDNTDPFMPPNISNTNPGNQMTVLGYGSSNAYQSNYGSSVSCQTTVGTPDLTASITGPASVSTNISTNYAINVNNIGNAATTGIFLVNTTLPVGVTYNGTSGNGWSSTTTAQANGSTLVTSTFNGSLATNVNTTPLVLNVTPTNVLPANTTFNISGNISGGGETNATNNNFSINSTVATNTATADLGVSIALDNKTPALGSTINYTFQITNNGSGVPNNISNQIVLPAGFSVSSVNTSAGTYNPNTGIWTIGSIPVGQSYTLNISGKPITEGVYYATCTITNSNLQDNNISNNSDAICYGVPVKLCSGSTFVARIDKKYTNVQWYKNTSPILGATADSLIINSEGTYTFTSSVACPQSGCCPIVVTTGQVSNNLSISPSSVSNCGNYNLTNLTVSLNNTVVNTGLSYYATQANAIAGTNQIGSIVTQTGTYWVRFKPQNNCASIDSVNVIINSSLTFTQPSPICATTFDLSSVTLFNNGVPVTSGISYYAAVYNASSSVIIIPLDNSIATSSGTYYATVKNANGCVSLASIQVNLLSMPATPNIQDANNVCPANTANLVSLQPSPSTVGGIFEWHISNSLTSPLVSNPTTVGAGNYYVFERSTAGCTSNGDAVKISIKDCCSSPDCLPFRLVKVKVN